MSGRPTKRLKVPLLSMGIGCDHKPRFTIATILPALPKICVRVTARCNLRCPFCLAPLYVPAELPASQLLEIMAILQRCGLRSISISGGEPLLYEDLDPLLLGVHELSLGMTIATNALLISQRHFELFRRVGCRVKVPILGAESTHNLLVGQDTYRDVDATVQALIAEGIPVGVNTVITRKNIHALAEVVSYAVDNGICRIRFIIFVPRGRGALHERRFSLTSDEVQAVEAEIEKLREMYSHGVSICYSNYWTNQPYYVLEPDGRLIAEGSREINDVILYRFQGGQNGASQ